VCAPTNKRQNAAVSHTHSNRFPDRAAQTHVLWLALVANALLMIAEAAGGFIFHSLSLLADSVHLLTDVSGLAIALLAQRLLRQPPSQRHSFGFQRSEVLAAQANAFILVAVSLWVIVEAIRRLMHPAHVSGAGLLIVASLGLIVNLGSAWLLNRESGRSLNMRGAFLHLASDAVGSLGAMLAGIAILIWDSHRADPTASLLISALVLWAAWSLLKDTTQVLLEGTPEGMDVEELQAAFVDTPDVQGVHHVHVWSLASDVPALSAHVVLDGSTSMHDAQIKAEELKVMLANRFGIDHATLEMECHPHEEHGVP
jgi:cobalt-zinc-cadmium efflux system protein